MRYLVIFICTFLLLSPLITAQAQTAASIDDLTGDFTFSLTPENPGPNQVVDITLENYSIDLNTASITWSANGARLASGKGVTHVQITTGGIGSRTTVAVSVSTDTNSFNRSITLAPGEVDLVWQGNTYVPPFYKGRSLWTDESGLTVLAVPNVGSGSAKNFIYKWSVNGEVQGDKSGAGRNTFTLSKAPLSVREKITVDVMTDANTVVAEGSTSVAPSAPQLLIYEDNPLYGLVFNNAINQNIILREQEVSFTGFPMFMNTTSRNASGLSYTWNVTGGAIQRGSRVTYRAPDGTTGKSEVTVDVNNTRTTYQSATNNFLVQFGNANSF